MITKHSNPKDSVAVRKMPLWLCSPIAKAHWCVAQLAGLIKYGAWNWRIAGVRTSVYISAMHRHLDAYSSGETYDPTDRTRHLGNIMACCAILMEAEAAGKLIDDRGPMVVPMRDTYDELAGTVDHLMEQYADYLPGQPKCPKHYTVEDTPK